MIGLREALQAWKRVRGVARETPLEYSDKLSRLTGARVYLKLENQQVTGSFKIRGATNKMVGLKARGVGGVVTASSGNHAQGVGHAARALGLGALVVVPERTPATKLEAIKSYGAELVVEGHEYMDSERLAKALAAERGLEFVSAYNDLDVIAGQATVALEMLVQEPGLDTVLVPVGGGGLASGVASVYKQTTGAQIVGVQSQASPVMYRCIQEGRIHQVPMGETVAEGLHGGLEEGSVTFEMCRDLVDQWAIVEEEEILRAIGYLLREHHQVAEGAGAVGVAALLREPHRWGGRRVGVVVTGGNLGAEVLERAVLGANH